MTPSRPGAKAPGGFESTWLRALALPWASSSSWPSSPGPCSETRRCARPCRGGLAQIGSLVWAVLYWPLLGLGYVVEGLLFVLTRLVPNLQDGPLGPRPRPLRDLLPEPVEAPAGTPPWVAALRWLLPGLVVLAVVAGFLATSSGVRDIALPRRRQGPERESLWSWSTLWRALRRWLSGLGRRLRVAVPGGLVRPPRLPPEGASGAGPGCGRSTAACWHWAGTTGSPGRGPRPPGSTSTPGVRRCQGRRTRVP